MNLVGKRRLRREPLVGVDADRLLGDVPSEERLSQAWLVSPEGRRWAGHEAIWHALYLTPVLGPLLRLFRIVPGFQPVSRWVYRRVAENRHSLGCALDHRKPE